jgi:hypothetical protein
MMLPRRILCGEILGQYTRATARVCFVAEQILGQNTHAC